MKNEFKRLMRRQVQERLDSFSNLARESTPKIGWVRLIRDALGISSRKLAQKLGCSQSNVVYIEKSEREGSITLNTLGNTARALNCKLVYCLIPEKPLNQILEDKAREIAVNLVYNVNHSMKLEGQGLPETKLKQQIEDLVQEFMHGNPKDLWNKYEN